MMTPTRFYNSATLNQMLDEHEAKGDQPRSHAVVIPWRNGTTQAQSLAKAGYSTRQALKWLKANSGHVLWLRFIARDDDPKPHQYRVHPAVVPLFQNKQVGEVFSKFLTGKCGVLRADETGRISKEALLFLLAIYCEVHDLNDPEMQAFQDKWVVLLDLEGQLAADNVDDYEWRAK